VNAVTGGEGPLPRVKPFKYTYEKEIVMYAYFKKLDYFSTECVYAPFAARGFARDFVKDLEVGRPVLCTAVVVDLGPYCVFDSGCGTPALVVATSGASAAAGSLPRPSQGDFRPTGA
jgi:hypothetical protein